MQLSARYNAVLELTEEIFKDKSPADGISTLICASGNISVPATAALLPKRYGKLSGTAGGWSLRHSLPIRGGFCWFI